MRRAPSRRVFDLSGVLALAAIAFLLLGMPGGCGDSENGDDESGDDVEAVAEPTAPPLMEIVEPEPGDVNTNQPADDEAANEDEPNEGAEDPEGAQEEEDPAADGVYVVQPGDTLYGIAVQFSVSMEALMDANDMDNPDQLQVGQELQIPD